MSEVGERALWQATADDYTKALKIALKAWTDLEATSSPEAIQSAAATILIHHKDLLRESHIVARVPAASTGGGRTPQSAGASGTPPSCPQCGGEMYDNREKKASGEFKPTSADFTCKDKQCKNAKGFRSGVWLEKANPKGAKGGAPVGVGSVADKPGPLVDEDDELPF